LSDKAGEVGDVEARVSEEGLELELIVAGHKVGRLLFGALLKVGEGLLEEGEDDIFQEVSHEVGIIDGEGAAHKGHGVCDDVSLEALAKGLEFC